jgi:hypothetical protein
MSSSQFCTLYLDASGDPGWPLPYGKSPLRWYVVAGLALVPEMDLEAHRESDRILKKYIPPPEWNSPKFELCMHDLQAGKGVCSAVQPSQRLSMMNDVFDLIGRLHPILFATAIDKSLLKKRYQLKAMQPKSLGVRATIHRFAMSLNRRKMIGSVTIDEEEYRKDKELQVMIRSFKRGDIVIRGASYQPRFTERIERILNTLNVASSAMAPGLQLADFCSRSTWLHFERKKSNRFNQLSSLWDRDANRVYEPSVFPKM